MMSYLLWFLLFCVLVMFGLAAVIILGMNMTRRQEIKAALSSLVKKVGSYVATHIDEAERARILEILDDGIWLSKKELLEIIKMLISPNKPTVEATPTQNKDSPPVISLK